MVERNQAAALIVVAVIVSSVALVALWYPITVPDVRIGYLSQDLHQLALRVAVEKGWFEEEGLVVELTQYQNGGYEMDGFLAGQIDMGYLGAAPAMIKSINQGTEITILAAVNLEGSAIMVLKEEYDAGRITTVEDLSGKTVYYPGPPTVQSFLLRLALNQSGLSFTDISAETTQVSYMQDSLSQSAPAFIAWEPFCAKAEGSNTAVPLITSGEIWARHPCCVLASTDNFLTNNPETVQKIVEIHKRAEEWIVDNPTEAIEIAIDWLEMDESVVENAFNRIIYDYNVNRTGLELYLNFLIDENIVEMEKSEMTSFLDDFINTTYIET